MGDTSVYEDVLVHSCTAETYEPHSVKVQSPVERAGDATEEPVYPGIAMQAEEAAAKERTDLPTMRLLNVHRPNEAEHIADASALR